MKLVALLAAVIVAAPALAQDPPAGDGKGKKICRMVEQTGSIILRKKYCLTREEWAKLNEATSDRAGRALDERRLGPNDSFNKD